MAIFQLEWCFMVSNLLVQKDGPNIQENKNPEKKDKIQQTKNRMHSLKTSH